MEEYALDDAALVESLRSGDPGAAARFFDTYGRYVERLLVRVLGPDPDVEDLLHDVFAEALANIARLRGENDGGEIDDDDLEPDDGAPLSSD